MSGNSRPSSDVDAGRAEVGDERRVLRRRDEPVGGHRDDLLVEALRHLRDGEALRERHLVVVCAGGVRSGQHVAHVVAGRDLVVARRDLQPTVVLDVPAEDAGVDDEASCSSRSLSESSVSAGVDREARRAPGVARRG